MNLLSELPTEFQERSTATPMENPPENREDYPLNDFPAPQPDRSPQSGDQGRVTVGAIL